MANYSDAQAVHPVAVANTVDVITMTSFGMVNIYNHGLATDDPLFIRDGAKASDIVDPTVFGNGCLMVPAKGALTIGWPIESAGAQAVLKVICAGANRYTVQVIPGRNP